MSVYAEFLQRSIEVPIDRTNLVDYSEVVAQARPFDLLAFRGGELISKLISVLEQHQLGCGEFSHVGMVVTAEILPKWTVGPTTTRLVPGKLYILEATFSIKIGNIVDGIPDIITSKGCLGVQLRDLAEVVPRYITSQLTRVALCRLINNPYEARANETREALELRRKLLVHRFRSIFESYYGRPYELDIVGLLGSIFPCVRPIRDVREAIYRKLYSILHRYGIAEESCGPSGWQFCSELVANVYQSLGVMPATVDPRNVLPMDFFGYGLGNVPGIVSSPLFIKDWDLPGQPAIVYSS